MNKSKGQYRAMLLVCYSGIIFRQLYLSDREKLYPRVISDFVSDRGRFCRRECGQPRTWGGITHFGRLIASLATILLGIVPALADGPVKVKIGWSSCPPTSCRRSTRSPVSPRM